MGLTESVQAKILEDFNAHDGSETYKGYLYSYIVEDIEYCAFSPSTQILRPVTVHFSIRDPAKHEIAGEGEIVGRRFLGKIRVGQERIFGLLAEGLWDQAAQLARDAIQINRQPELCFLLSWFDPDRKLRKRIDKHPLSRPQYQRIFAGMLKNLVDGKSGLPVQFHASFGAAARNSKNPTMLAAAYFFLLHAKSQDPIVNKLEKDLTRTDGIAKFDAFLRLYETGIGLSSVRKLWQDIPLSPYKSAPEVSEPPDKLAAEYVRTATAQLNLADDDTLLKQGIRESLQRKLRKLEISEEDIRAHLDGLQG